MTRTDNGTGEIELDSFLPDESELQRQVQALEQERQQQEQQQQQQQQQWALKRQIFDWKTYFPTQQELNENPSVKILFSVFLVLVWGSFSCSFFLHGTNRATAYYGSFALVGVHEILTLLRFQKDKTEKGIRLRSSYFLMFLLCCVYFFFVLFDTLLKQCSDHSNDCHCGNPLTLLFLILLDFSVATFKLSPFWALSSLPLVLVALLEIVSLFFGRKVSFKNPRWVSSLTVGVLGIPSAIGSLTMAGFFLVGILFLLFDFCTPGGHMNYIQ